MNNYNYGSQNKEISIHRGDTLQIICRVTSNKVAYNLTGYDMIFTLKDKFLTADSGIILTIPGVIAVPSSGCGVINVTHAHSDREDKKYVYDIKIYKADGSDIKTLSIGLFTILPVARRDIPIT
jgi:hypothetical protein